MSLNPPVKLLSCDTHLEHWPTVLKEYIPQKLHDLFDKAPYAVKMFGVVPHYGPDGICTSVLAGYAKNSEVKEGVLDPRTQKIPGAYGGPDEYAKWMRLDGVTTAVILPGAGLGATIGMAKASGDKEAYLAVLQGYNNYVNDFCNAYPDLFIGGACLPTTGVDDAIAEMRRVRKLPGIRTVSPGAFPNGSTSPKPEDDRFYAEALELNMPLTMHGGISSPTSGGVKTKQDCASWIIGHVEVTTGGPYSASQLIMSGVFDRFPKLRFIMLECGAGWLPFSMDTMNHFYDRQRHWAGIDLKNPPAWYCTSGNFLWNVISDRVAIKLRDEIGVDNLSWSSDFPHGNSEWPEDRARALKLVEGCTPDERHKILWSNAAKFYGLE